ncbi:hypothetical protein PtB15_2B741 [Puccinia triticina]|nr:hypothetical protein PtB15_2B741 [Puccinia triticina]
MAHLALPHPPASFHAGSHRYRYCYSTPFSARLPPHPSPAQPNSIGSKQSTPIMTTTNMDQSIDPLLGGDAAKKTPIKKSAGVRKKRKVSGKSINNSDNANDGSVASDHKENREEIQIVICETTFKFYVLDQALKGKKIWVPISSERSFDIPITASPADQATSYADFVTQLSAECKAVEVNTGRLVIESWKSEKPAVTWAVSIPRVAGFAKGKPFLVNNEEAYNKWIEALVENKSDATTLSLKMKNPNAEAKRAHNAQVLAKEAIRTEAKRMIQSERGVSLQSPPKVLRYESVSANQISSKAKAQAIGGSQPNCGGCCSSSHHQNKSQAPVSSDGPRPGPNAGIREYVEFIGLREASKVIDILVENDMINYKSFRSSNLDRAELRGLGLTIGVVTELADNVGKFERHLAHQEAQEE